MATRTVFAIAAMCGALAGSALGAQGPADGIVIVRVTADSERVAQAEVRAGSVTATTNDYTYFSPSVFVQDDYAPFPWLTASASGRVDIHSEFGTFFSPRVSVLGRPGTGWTVRLSTGTGFNVPTPFTEDTEATGWSRLAPLGELEPERGRSVSLDVGWKKQPLELTATLFRSKMRLQF